MTARVLTCEVLRDGLVVKDFQLRVDLDDERSTKQLDEHLRDEAERHGRGPLSDYSLRVLDGTRVVLPAFKTHA